MVYINSKLILTPKVQPLLPRFNSISHCVPAYYCLEDARRSEHEDVKYDKMSSARRRKQRQKFQFLARIESRHSVLIAIEV